MPRYIYECNTCGHREEHERSVEERDVFPFHQRKGDHGDTMRRLVGAGVQINANPMHLREENRLPTGFSALDALAMRKEDDAQYELDWDGQTPGKPDEVLSLGEAGQMITRDDVEQATAEYYAGEGAD